MSETHRAAPPLAEPLDASASDASPARRRATLALRAAGAALLFGAVCDAMLRTDGLGVNVPIIVGTLVAAALLLLRERYGEVPREAAAAGAVAMLFAAFFVWRDSGMLAFLNIVAIIGALAMLSFAALRAPLANLRFGTVGEYLLATVRSARDAIGGAIPLALRDVDLHGISAGLRGHRLQRVALGLLLAVPLLLVFGSIFAQADAVFGALAADLLRFDVGLVVSHVAVTCVFAWLGGGWLRGALLVPRDPEIRGPIRLTLGIVEIGIALALLDALFALFVGVQLRYLFGGEALVRSTAGLTYAEYARSGFFELCTAAALVIPVLLGSRALLRVETPRDARIHRALSVTLVALVAVVVISALARLRLYVATYGWTEDRVLAIAIVGWLGTVFAWYLATVLRGRDRGFAFGAVASGALILGQLNVFGPDAWIVTRNREMALSGARVIDSSYGPWSLSADAVPAYLPTLSLLPEPARCDAVGSLLERWGGTPGDWRGWSVGRARARAAVARIRPELDAFHATPVCVRQRAPHPRVQPPAATPAPAVPPAPAPAGAPSAVPDQASNPAAPPT